MLIRVFAPAPAGSAIALLASVAGAPLAGQQVFDMQPLASGIYAAVVVPEPAAYAFANSLVVIGTDGVLVVDTQQSLTAATSLITEIRRLTGAPVRWVVNTHWHGDHVNGNQAYVSAFPDVEIIGHASLYADLKALATARTRELEQLPASIRDRERWLKEDIGPDGKPLTEQSRRTIRRSADLRRAYLADLTRTAPPPPGRVVHDSLELHVGDHRLRIVHVGPAHTRGDLLVTVLGAGITVVGDLLETGMPYFADAYPAGWLDAIGRIAAQEPAVILPAHGDVQRDGTLMADTQALLAQVQRSAECARLRGRDDAAPCRDTLAVHVIATRWQQRYDVSGPAFHAAFERAVERALLEGEGP